MTTTSRYIVSGTDAGQDSFIDFGTLGSMLGISDALREFIYQGGAGNAVAVYMRSGIALDFATQVGSGARTVYLDGSYADYTFNTAAGGQLSLNRGSGSTAESLKVLANANTTLVFADGSAATDAPNLAAGSATLDTGTTTPLSGAGLIGKAQNISIAADNSGAAVADARTATLYSGDSGVYDGAATVGIVSGGTISINVAGGTVSPQPGIANGTWQAIQDNPYSALANAVVPPTPEGGTVKLDNAAPVASATPIPTQHISAATTGTILDLADVAPATPGAQPAFTDADTARYPDSRLTYSAQSINKGADGALGGGDDSYGALPAWLEVTGAGLVQVAAGQTPVPGRYDIHITAADHLRAKAARDISVDVGITLASASMQGKNNLDLRSNLELFADQDVNLVDAANAQGMSITLVNTADASRSITLDLTRADDRAMVGITHGSEKTAIVINPAFDLDANTAYRIDVSAGAFVAASGSGTGTLALDAANGIAFNTIALRLLAAGEQIGADLWKAPDPATGVAGWDQVAWHQLVGSGTNGTEDNGYTRTKTPTPNDAGEGAHVFYLGAITDAGGKLFTTAVDAWAQVNNFGADDRFYFDDTANNVATYGKFDIAASVGVGTYDDADDGIDGNRVSVGGASRASDGLRVDMTLDITAGHWTGQSQNHASAWDGATEPTFHTVFGVVPVLVA